MTLYVGNQEIEKIYFKPIGSSVIEIDKVYDGQGREVFSSELRNTLTITTNVSNCNVVFNIDGVDYAPTKATSNTYSLTTPWIGEISYTVSKTDYSTVTGSVPDLLEDRNVNVSLVYLVHTLTVNANVSGATATFTYNGTSYPPTSVSGTAYMFATLWTGAISYSVSKTDYTTASGSVASLTSDTSVFVSLTYLRHTLTINTNVDGCTVVFNYDGKNYNPTSSSSKSYSLSTLWTGAISYNVSKNGYITKSGSVSSLTKDTSVSVSLDVDPYIGDIYNAKGVLVSISSLTTVVDDQFFSADKYNRNLSGELKEFPTTSIGYRGFNQAFDGGRNLTGAISFPNLTSSGEVGLFNAFNYCDKLTSISFPKLETVNDSGMYDCFNNCDGLTSISFPSLTTIKSSGMFSCFEDCENLKTISFPELVSVESNGFYMAFYNCTNLEGEIYFPKLTTLNGTQALYHMFGLCKKITNIHFKKSLKSNSACTASNLNLWDTTKQKVLFDIA